MIMRSWLKTHPAESVLGQIVENKIEEVSRRIEALPLSAITDSTVRSDRSFLHALESSLVRPSLIAEIKRRSPSKGALRAVIDLPAIARAYDAHASAISVVTDEHFFGGSLELLREVRRQVRVPVLMKDFVVSEYQLYEARRAGADAILLLASVLEREGIETLLALARTLGMGTLVETHDAGELELVLGTKAAVIGINNRNLHTLEIDPGLFHRLAPRIPADRIVVAESGVKTKEDVARLRGVAEGVLIGTALMEADDVEARIRSLGW